MNNITYQRRIVNNRLRQRVNQPSEPDVVEIPAPQEKSYYFAGFWMRFWAFLLDLLTVFSLNGLLVYPLLRMTNIDEWFPLTISIKTLLTAAVFFLYFAIMTKKYGQTIGKMIFGLRVITTKGDELTWGQIIFREGIGRFLHQVFFFLQAIYIMVAFTRNKQGLHDVIADTYVIQERR